MSFSGSCWHLKARDTWIGWSDAARLENLQKVIGNSRFLILPTVRVPNLASHILSLTLKRLVRDWIQRYGYAPVLVETFVDPKRFTGTSYRAVKEIQKLCPDTMLVSIGDREADIYELFYETTLSSDSPELLVRADRGRKRKVGQVRLWDKMKREPVACYEEIKIPRRKSSPARTAKLELRYAKVKLEPPIAKKHLPVIEIWAVYVREIDYSSDVRSPLEWMLLTTVEVSTNSEAVEKLDWYTCRWGIEVYHRVLKSGCRIEDRRLGKEERIESCLAIDLVVAWSSKTG